MPEKITLTFSPQTLDVVAAAIRELPYRMAAPILDDMQRQINEQTKPPAEKAPAE